MKKFALYRCKACNAVSRGPELLNEEMPEETPVDALRSLVGIPKHKSIADHQCSPHIAGVADFAGVEFSEE